LNKIEDFGVHCKSYYSLETSIFKSQTDNLLLKTLWNKYWASTLSSSTLKTYVLKKSIITKNNLFRFNNNGFRNEDYITEQIKDISGKLEHVSDQVCRSGGNWGVRFDESGNIKNDDRLTKSVKDCNKLMNEIKYGINMQNLKSKLFSA